MATASAMSSEGSNVCALRCQVQLKRAGEMNHSRNQTGREKTGSFEAYNFCSLLKCSEYSQGWSYDALKLCDGVLTQLGHRHSVFLAIIDTTFCCSLLVSKQALLNPLIDNMIQIFDGWCERPYDKILAELNLYIFSKFMLINYFLSITFPFYWLTPKNVKIIKYNWSQHATSIPFIHNV